MKMSKLKILAIAILAFSPAVAFADAAPGAGLLGTDHDFASGTGAHTASTAVGLCTFCHTPHKAKTTLLLWNHTLSSNTFQWDVTATTAGTAYPTIAGGTYKGPTAKCLSCHDGSVAIGDLYWFNAQPNQGANAITVSNGGVPDSHIVGAGGDMTGTHPVAMPYPYNNTANTYNGKRNGDGLQTAEWQADPTALAGAKIRLFNDDGSGNISAGVVAGKTGIECASCHDPHNKSAVDAMFLRGMMTGSAQSDGYLCLQCHKK